MSSNRNGLRLVAQRNSVKMVWYKPDGPVGEFECSWYRKDTGSLVGKALLGEYQRSYVARELDECTEYHFVLTALDREDREINQESGDVTTGDCERRDPAFDD
ncbi:unnamed protein product [Calicophoron daubneyi]|uniref:Fibronectin type-III domain-containing protein n=1 Tax=Calicophoron daubneyi TaxID=300641 RepID=A0AAV2T993_CALDB